jgi:hypothetical protein
MCRKSKRRALREHIEHDRPAAFRARSATRRSGSARGERLDVEAIWPGQRAFGAALRRVRDAFDVQPANRLCHVHARTREKIVTPKLTAAGRERVAEAVALT